MDGEKRKKNELELETFDLYESIRPRVEEFLDEWFIVGIRPECGSRILVGSKHSGLNRLQVAYDAVQNWKR